jgi:uncharacterized alpha-E superfamily protein
MEETLSVEGAEHLFWLGRYTQRVYTILHFFRKFRDEIIDVDEGAYALFCEKLGIENKYTSAQDFLSRYLYDNTEPDSLVSALMYAHNNAIVLRQAIKSETISYVQLCLTTMEKCSDRGADVNDLQDVTDRLMAFWGAVDERIFEREVRHMIKAGWYLETLDLHIRFGYSHKRLLTLRDRLERHLRDETTSFNHQLFGEIKEAMENPAFDRPRVLDMLSRVFVG